jgi:tRNA (guanine-N7-)-methyltransferase
LIHVAAMATAALLLRGAPSPSLRRPPLSALAAFAPPQLLLSPRLALSPSTLGRQRRHYRRAAPPLPCSPPIRPWQQPPARSDSPRAYAAAAVDSPTTDGGGGSLDPAASYPRDLSAVDEGDEESSSSSSSSSSSDDPRYRRRRKSLNNGSRFRQHVNPLARRHQQPCPLEADWPASAFDDPSRYLHLDVGSGKGGFLIELASRRLAAEAEAAATGEGEGAAGGPSRAAEEEEVNYLGLEIRPPVAQHARDRLLLRPDQLRGRVDFLACNANVDLARILDRYSLAAASGSSASAAPRFVLEAATIQFPDPHFKSHHAKRRVVTPDLVAALARHLRPGRGRVFLQSDVRPVLEGMRDQFKSCPGGLFRDLGEEGEYDAGRNVFGVPTERETSVLDRGLPVYRAWLERTLAPCPTEEGNRQHPVTSDSEASPTRRERLA